MAALNPYEYGHIIPWYAQFLDINGQPLSGGYVEIYEAGTTTPYISFQNFDGTPNPFRIQLTTGARTVAIGKISKRYDIYVYNQFGNLEYSRLNIGAGDSEGVNLTFTSSDGSIIITRDGNTVDLVVKKDEEQFGTIGGSTVDENGKIIFNTVESGDITVNAGNIQVEALKLYHVTVHLDFEGFATGNSYLYCKLVDSEGGEHKFSVDNSRSKQWDEVSWDIIPSRSWISLEIDGLDSTTSLSKATVYIHRVNPVVGSNSGGGGGGSVNDVTVNGTSVVSGGVARVTVPTKTSDLTNDSGFITSSDVPNEIIYINLTSAYYFNQVFEDWDAFQHAILGEGKCIIGIYWTGTGQFETYYLSRFEDKDNGAKATFSPIPHVKYKSTGGSTHYDYASMSDLKDLKVVKDDNSVYKFDIISTTFDQDIYNKTTYDARYICISPYDFASRPGSPAYTASIPYGAVVLTPGGMYRCILSYHPQSTDTTFDSTHWEETKFDMAIYNICNSITDVDTVRICIPSTSFSDISTWLGWHKQCVLIDTDGIYEVSNYDASSITFTRCGIGANGEAVVYKDVLNSSNVHTKSTSSTLPAYSSTDAGKTLQVQADGTLAWV